MHLLLALSLVQGAAPPDSLAPVRAAMRRMVDTVRAASVAVAVAKDGRIVFEEAIGWADRENRIPAGPNTIYALASISKPLTATALMILAERGRIDLDRPINDYLGAAKVEGLAGPAAGATIRRVMSHTAGLPLHSHFFYADRGGPPPAMDQTIGRYGKLVFPPGVTFEYSNLGYGILGYAMERVSGQSYAEVMRRELFAPLGLTRTSVDSGRRAGDTVATLYGYDGRPLPYFTFDHPGASSVFSSAHDLIRFAMLHLKNRLPGRAALLSDSAIDLMHRTVPPAVDYGLGFSVRDGGFRVAHSGGMPGATALMVLYPSRNMALVILSNTSTRSAAVMQQFAIMRAVEAVMLPGDGGATPPGTRGAASTGALAGDWLGTVRTHEGAIPLRLSIGADGTMRIRLADQADTTLANTVLSDSGVAGAFAGRFPSADAGRWPHGLSLRLLLRSGKLAGQLTAHSSATDRVYFSLSGFVELIRPE